MRRLFPRLFDSGIHVSYSNISVTLSNIPYLPFTKRAALRCTISSLSELYFWRGCQTVALYSRKDLTREKYAVSLSFSGQPFRLRLRNDNLEFALDVMTSMCFVHFKLLFASIGAFVQSRFLESKKLNSLTDSTGLSHKFTVDKSLG